MPTPTYTPLANITLSSSATSITFSSIPQTYRDLVVVYSLITTYEGTFSFNGGASIPYESVVMSGNGSTTYSSTFSRSNASTYLSYGAAGNLGIMNIMDYSATDKHKSILHRVNFPNPIAAVAQRWESTSAINSITFGVLGGSIAAGSYVQIYGIAA